MLLISKQIRDKIAINTELYDKKASMYDTSMKNHQDRVQLDVEKQMGDFKTEMNEKFATVRIFVVDGSHLTRQIIATQDGIQSDVSQIKGQVGNIETQIKVQVGNIETLLNERLPPPSPNPQDPTNHPLA